MNTFSPLPGFFIRKDSKLDTLSVGKLDASNIGSIPPQSQVSMNAISSGTYDADPQVYGWTSPVVTISSARYILITGTQHISITGSCTMTSTSVRGDITFKTPFYTSSIPDTLFGGSSTCHPGDLSSVIPSIVECIDGNILLTVIPSAPISRVDFNITIMAGVSTNPVMV